MYGFIDQLPHFPLFLQTVDQVLQPAAVILPKWVIRQGTVANEKNMNNCALSSR